MTPRKQPLLLVVLSLLMVTVISACSAQPLPPLFYIGSGPAPAATQVAQAPAQPEPTAAPVEEPTAVVEPTVAPTEEPTATATEEPTATPTEEPTAIPTEEPTATASAVPPTATPRPTRAAATATPRSTRAAATATPTRVRATPTPEWPKTIVITESQIEEMAASGSVPGLQITGLDVTFGNDTMTVFFSTLKYSFISLRDVTIEGHFDVNNGTATFVADRIAPRNLATTQIPGFINQALAGEFSQWYVEDVTIEPGQLTATVRPRS